MEEIRIQKFLADNGIASRRKCEEYILQGKVRVNDNIVTTLGTKINSQKDKVYYNNKLVENKKDKIYILLNKPIGYVTTVKEQFDRPTVLDLIPIKERIVPVGRLDMYTSGAIILTNDGDFVYKVTHPKYEIDKTYIATVKGNVTLEEQDKLRNGIEIENYTTGKAKVKIIKQDNKTDISRIAITIHEGKNREVRKMCEAIGKKVLALHRIKIGELDIKDLKIGQWRYLTKAEINNVVKEH